MQDFGHSLLILGGARSGKSRHGQQLAERIGGPLTYIATAQAFDQEMKDRIARHQEDRDGRWRTVEAPIALAEAIAGSSGQGGVVLVDCLTLWTSNLLLAELDVAQAVEELVAVIEKRTARLILIANETGLGIVPDNALARRFRDAAGMMNQRIASAVDTVDFVLAGLPQRWKATSD